jgi:hypothetical protein
METTITEGMPVVTSDDHKIGKVVGRRDDCVLVETGHVFKSVHAIPHTFLHEFDGELRATVAKEIVDSSPKVDGDDWDCHAVLMHYGLEGPFEVDPDPEGTDNAETEAIRHGVTPAPAERLEVQKGEEPPEYTRPTIRERSGNANDPTGVTANRRAR